MRAHGIGAKRRGKPWRTTKSDPNAQRPRDLVKRDFTASAPNRLWVGDFTYLRCWEGVVYFSFVIDVFSRMIVGWQLAGNMRTDLVLDALRSRRRAEGRVTARAQLRASFVAPSLWVVNPWRSAAWSRRDAKSQFALTYRTYASENPAA